MVPFIGYAPEAWKAVPGYEAYYAISSYGRVKRLCAGGPTRAGHILTPSKDRCGYLRVRLCRNAEDQKTWKVHRLVLAAFVGARGPEWDANHKNGDRADNRIENLEYLNHRDNVLYSVRELGTYSKKGKPKPTNAKITQQIADEIRLRVSSGERPYTLAKSMGINKSVVYSVVYRKSWV